MVTVIKIGGHEIADENFLSALAETVHRLASPVIIVHGGGKEISALQEQLGITPRYLDGVRITDAPSLQVVEMVLCGTVNKRLVRYLLGAGVDAIGMSGVDRGLITATPMQRDGHDMGYTGEVQRVQAEVLYSFLQQNITPVIAPICLGTDSAYNVNADHVAGAVAAAIEAERAVFLTNVPGVLSDGQVLAQLSISEAEALIAHGVISGGMIPKVKTALAVLHQGVSRVVITNLEGLQNGGGTTFVQ